MGISQNAFHEVLLSTFLRFFISYLLKHYHKSGFKVNILTFQHLYLDGDRIGVLS